MLLLFKPCYFFTHRDSQRIPSRAFRSTKEALKQCFVLYALEGKVIIKASQRCSKPYEVSCNKYSAMSCGYAEHPIPRLRLAVRLTLSPPAHPHTPSSFAWFKNWMLSPVSACPKGLKDGNKAALSEKENVEQCLRSLCQATLSQRPYTAKTFEGSLLATKRLWKHSPHFTHSSHPGKCFIGNISL